MTKQKYIITFRVFFETIDRQGHMIEERCRYFVDKAGSDKKRFLNSILSFKYKRKSPSYVCFSTRSKIADISIGSMISVTGVI